MSWNKSSLTQKHNKFALYSSMLFGCLIIRLQCEAPQDVAALRNVSPGVDEVLGHADAGRRAADRDLAHG